MDENRLVGKDNKIPWRIEEDLKHFQNITRNKTVLIGYNTYLSMKWYYKNKSFPFKEVYIASREVTDIINYTVVDDVDKFLKAFEGELFVLGGPIIYEIALNYADYLYITYVLDTYEGDAYFPRFDLSNYKLLEYKTSNKLIYTKYKNKAKV